jgi:hypothetical protein
MFEEAMKLEHHADLAPKLPHRRRRNLRAAFERHAVDCDAARLKRLQPGDRAKDGRLAGP